MGRARQRGVSLIELMVGLLIGLLAVLVISQVLISVEGQKRTVTSGADAQLTGTLALYTLSRDIEMSGYGLTTSQIGLGCRIRSLRFTPGNGGVDALGVPTRRLAPVVITNGVGGAPDQLRIFSASKASFSVPVRVTSDHPRTGAGADEFIVNNTIGIEAGDLMVAVPNPPDANNPCTVFRATGPGSIAGLSLRHASVSADTNAWNGNQTDLLNLFPVAGYPAGSYLVNLGAGLIDRSYSVVNGNLQVTEFDTATVSLPAVPPPLFPQVVNLQAYYGKDSDGNGSIDQYDTVTPGTPAEWAQVVAVRLAIVVRSNQYEADEVTTVAPVWNLGSTPSVVDPDSVVCGTARCLSMPVTGDINATDWKHYRYKVYDTVVPLRNLLWRA
jgi:type IV pilus assembly protein PilW